MGKTTKVLLIVCMALVCLITGCSNSSKSKEELYTEGLRLIGEKNYRGSVVYFKNALEKDPNFSDARIYLARAYMHTGQLDSAEKDLRKVIRQMPSNKDAHKELARVYVYKNKADEALNELGELSIETSADADALEIAGQAYIVKKEFISAENLLRKAIAADTGGKTTAQLTLARLYMLQNKLPEAKDRISEMLKKEPTNAKALYLLADIQGREKDADAVLGTYEQILKNDPNDPIAKFRKGTILISRKQYDAALAQSQELIDKQPKRPEGYRLKGMVLVLTNKAGDAIAVLQKSISMGPDVSAYYFLGLANIARNEPEQAVSQFNKALDLNPKFHPARLLLASTLMQQKRTDDAINEVRKVIEADPQNAQAHNILAGAYMQKGQVNEGMEELNRALEIDPGLVDVHIKKGLVNISRGNSLEGEIDLRAAVQAAPDVLNPKLLLVSYYLKKNEHAKAVGVLKTGLKGTKEDAAIYNYIAKVYFLQDKQDDGMKMLSKAKAADPDFLDTYGNLAVVYFIKKDFDKAILELRTILEKSPNNLKALLELAGVSEARGMDADAKKYYEQAKATKKTEAYAGFAKYYLRKKDHSKAISLLNEAIKQNPSDTAPYFMKAGILVSQKKYTEAIRCFEQLERIDPKQAFPAIVTVYLAMKKPDEALSRVTKELKKKPGDVTLMAEVSRIQMIKGNKQEALQNAKEIISTKPDSPVGYLTLAAVHMNGKETDTAIDVLKWAGSLKNDNIDMMLASLYMSKKDFTAALETYKKIEKTNPGNVAAIFQQGAVYAEMDKSKNAVKEYSRALLLSGNYMPALNNLAYIYADEGRELGKALQYASRAYALSPNNGSVLDTMGYVLLKNKKADEAFKILKRASELIPDNPTILYHLALACNELKDRPGAKRYLEQAVRMGNFPEEGSAKALLNKLKGG